MAGSSVLSQHYTAYSGQIIAAVKSELNSKVLLGKPDLTIVCKDGDVVKTYQFLFSVFSSYLRGH